MVSYATRIEWYKNQGTDPNPVLITDWTSIVIKRGLNSKSNRVDITLKNKLSENSGSGDVHEYTNAFGELLFQQNDIIKVYVAAQETADDTIDTSADSADLLTTADLEEWSTLFDGRHTRLKISCMDKAFQILSNLWAEAFTDSDALTAPQIVQQVVRATTDGVPGEGYDDDGFSITPGKYLVDARLFSDGVVASDTTTSTSTDKLVDSGASFTSTVDKGDFVRNKTDDKYCSVVSVDSDTQLTLSRDLFVSGEDYQVSDGFIQDTRIDGSVFGQTTLSKVWKPVYEWIEDLSDIRSTNSAAEIAGTIVQDRNMVYYIDEKNRFHWFYPEDDLDYDLTFGTVGDDGEQIRNVKLTKKTFDIVNMVIFNGGEDLDGVGTLNYFYNENTELKRLRMKYIPMTEISRDLKIAEKNAGAISIAADGVVTVDTGFPYTTTWGTSVDNETEFKDEFRTEVIRRGQVIARAFTNRRASPRWAKSITTNYNRFQPGELIRISSRQYGIKNKLVRIQDVTHNLTKGSFTTTIEVEEDEPKVGEVV